MNKIRANITLNRPVTFITISLLFFLCSISQASDLDIPNTFIANQPAVAADVNANFDAIEVAVDDNNSRLAALEALVVTMQATATAQQTTIDQLQSELATLQNNTVLELDGLLQYALIDGYDTAEFTNVNVQINDGSGDTDGEVNGKGNLTIGYHETSPSALDFCSDPQYTDSVNCIGNLEIWDNNVRTGSHNLIIGVGHSFTSFGSIISGSTNISNAEYANILGGTLNNTSGILASILSGERNNASGYASSILGGRSNVALGEYSSMSGGRLNSASGDYSNVSGGRLNSASGDYSNVSGGSQGSATGNDDWVAGTLSEDN
ncbi:MAG: hypothetical protein AB8B80_04490 [Marinicellaceae bacterium]